MKKLLILTVAAAAFVGCETIQGDNDINENAMYGGDYAMQPDCDTASYAVYFDTGSYALDIEDNDTLDTVASAAQYCDVDYLELVGYADSVGATQTNLALSENRAESVLMALGERDVRPDFIRIVPRGESVAPQSEIADAWERKVVITLVPDMNMM